MMFVRENSRLRFQQRGESMVVLHPTLEPTSTKEAGPSERQNPPHPGELLRAHLKRRGNTQQRKFAAEMGIGEQYLSDVLRGRTGISVRFALALERALGTAPLHWLYAQARYDLSQARRRQAEVNTQTDPEDTEA